MVIGPQSFEKTCVNLCDFILDSLVEERILVRVGDAKSLFRPQY